jgi:hypothetical protein
MRFSLLGLLALVTILGLGLGLLATPSPLSLKSLNLLYLLCLIVSTVVAFTARPERRSFWIGAAAVGWTYWLTLGFTTREKGHPTRYTALPTDDLAVALQSLLKHRTRIGEHVEGLRGRDTWGWGTVLEADDPQFLIQWDDGMRPRWTAIRPPVETPEFLRSAHSLLGIMLWMIGGIVAAAITRLIRGRAPKGPAPKETAPMKPGPKEPAPKGPAP